MHVKMIFHAKALANEWAWKGLTSTQLRPGYVGNALTRFLSLRAARCRMDRRLPGKNLGGTRLRLRSTHAHACGSSPLLRQLRRLSAGVNPPDLVKLDFVNLTVLSANLTISKMSCLEGGKHLMHPEPSQFNIQ